MSRHLSRRSFVKASILASAAAPLGLSVSNAAGAEAAPTPGAARPTPELFPMGKIAGQSFSRLFMGGNLIGGWAHARDLSYVSPLMRRYNTPAKIRQTLEIAEQNGIT